MIIYIYILYLIWYAQNCVVEFYIYVCLFSFYLKNKKNDTSTSVTTRNSVFFNVANYEMGLAGLITPFSINYSKGSKFMFKIFE